MWKQIKCKKCGCQDKPLFMLYPLKEADDCFCEDCKTKESKSRAK